VRRHHLLTFIPEKAAMDAWFIVLIGVLALSTWASIALFSRLMK